MVAQPDLCVRLATLQLTVKLQGTGVQGQQSYCARYRRSAHA